MTRERIHRHTGWLAAISAIFAFELLWWNKNWVWLLCGLVALVCALTNLRTWWITR